MKCDRTTLYSDIALLNKFGYEILCHRGTSNKYYVVNRDFDIPEIQILIDAVQAASFITDTKTPVLIDKLAQLAGSKRAAVLKKNIVEFSTIKGENEWIYYSIDEITTAITQAANTSARSADTFTILRSTTTSRSKICRKIGNALVADSRGKNSIRRNRSEFCSVIDTET